MRVWIINHYAITPDTSGGTRHYNFAQQLIKRGHEVTIIAANYNHFTQSFIQQANQPGQLDRTYEVPFIWIPVPAYRGNTVSRFWNMIVFSKRLLQKKYLPRVQPPDVIIGSSPHLFAALAAYRVAKKLKKPYILEVRDIWPDTLVELGRFTRKHPLILMMKYIEKYLYRNCQHIITLLPFAEKYLKENGVDSQKITWLPNVVNVEKLDQVKTIPSSKPFTVMYAGAHGIANDLKTVLKAAKILQNKRSAENIRICLVGEGPEKTILKQVAAQEKIANVFFGDAVSKNEIYHVLNEAHVFLMLLKDSPVFRWGISPNKLFDYLLMARPIIFGVNTLYNPVERAGAGLSIPPSNAQALADAIHTLSQLTLTELAEMGQRGREYVLKNHDLIILSQTLESLTHRLRQDHTA